MKPPAPFITLAQLENFQSVRDSLHPIYYKASLYINRVKNHSFPLLGRLLCRHDLDDDRWFSFILQCGDVILIRPQHMEMATGDTCININATYWIEGAVEVDLKESVWCGLIRGQEYYMKYLTPAKPVKLTFVGYHPDVDNNSRRMIYPLIG